MQCRLPFWEFNACPYADSYATAFAGSYSSLEMYVAAFPTLTKVVKKVGKRASVHPKIAFIDVGIENYIHFSQTFASGLLA